MAADSTPDIVVVGSVAYDDVETPLVRKQNLLGGSATFFSLAASYKARVGLVASVGQDFADKDRILLDKSGVDLQGLEVKKGRTFHWAGRYEKDPNKRTTLSLNLGVFAGFQPLLPDAYCKAKAVFLGNIDPRLQEKVLDSATGAKLVGCDTMNHWIESQRGLLLKTLSRVHLLVVNDEEARLLTGEDNMAKAGAALLKMGPKAALVKRGEHGVILFTREGHRILPAALLDSVVDPTGAGDSFAGALFSVLVKEKKPLSLDALAKASFWGTVIASFCVETHGAGALAGLDKARLARREKDLKVSFGH